MSTLSDRVAQAAFRRVMELLEEQMPGFLGGVIRNGQLLASRLPVHDVVSGHTANTGSTGDVLTRTAEGIAFQAPAGAASLPWFNVRSYGAKGDGSTDDTTAINDAITALNAAGGGVLYFPASSGAYLTTGGHTISNRAVVMGDDGWWWGGDGQSIIACASGTATVFTCSAHAAFRNIGLVNTASPAPSAGAGIAVAGSTNTSTRVDFEGVTVTGFYVNIDVQTSFRWSMHRCTLTAPVKYALKVANTKNVDTGDWSISSSAFHAGTTNSDAAIRIESSGGGKIVNCKVNMHSDGTKFAHGIDLYAGSGATSILLIANCSIENVRANGINVASAAGANTWNYITITGNQISLYNDTGTAISVAAAEAGDLDYLIINGNNLNGYTANAQYAIALTNVAYGYVGGNVARQFSGGLLSQTSCSDISTGGSGTPASTVQSETTWGLSASAGTSANYAREDHTHGTPADPGSSSTSGYTEGARVYNSAAIATTNNNMTALTFDTERYDTDTIHDTGSNTGRLTCKTAGKYIVAGHVMWDNNATGERFVGIRLNGTTYIAQEAYTTGYGTPRFTVTTIYDLGINDYVELMVRQQSGGNLNVYAGANYSPEFMMQRIG